MLVFSRPPKKAVEKKTFLNEENRSKREQKTKTMSTLGKRPGVGKLDMGDSWGWEEWEGVWVGRRMKKMKKVK